MSKRIPIFGWVSAPRGLLRLIPFLRRLEKERLRVSLPGWRFTRCDLWPGRVSLELERTP